MQRNVAKNGIAQLIALTLGAEGMFADIEEYVDDGEPVDINVETPDGHKFIVIVTEVED